MHRCIIHLIVILLIPLSGCAVRPTSVVERPNIIVILADDMGYSDIGPYGGEIRTPNLDRMAAGGLRFRQFYTTAKCSPTRAALLTGLYPHEVGMGELAPGRGKSRPAGAYQGYLPDGVTTVADALREAGYRTYMSGKWHIGDDPEHWPRRHGFDRYFGLISGASSFYEIIPAERNDRQMVLEDRLWTPPQEGFYATDAYSDYAVDRIQEHARQDPSRPFFLYLAYTAPHFPLQAPAEDIIRYKGRYDAGWDSLRAERFARMRRMGVLTDRHVLAPRPGQVQPWNTEKDMATQARMMEVYAAMIDRMDQGIGRVLRALEETGELDNTLILFLSDNGACAESVTGRKLNDQNVPIGARGSYVSYEEPWAYASNTPFRLYKNWLHEGGINSPLIAYWPSGIRRPGTFTNAVGHVIDILPTALELAGAAPLAKQQGWEFFPLEGRSLVPALRGEPVREGRKLFWAYNGNAAMRDGRWKLVYDSKRLKRWELFDMSADPSEMNDLAARHPERVTTMAADWVAWARRAGVGEKNFPAPTSVSSSRPGQP